MLRPGREELGQLEMPAAYLIIPRALGKAALLGRPSGVIATVVYHPVASPACAHLTVPTTKRPRTER